MSKSKPEEADISIDFELSKSDGERGQVFGWASIVEKQDGSLVVDSQGDVITADELEKAAHDFVLNARLGGDMHKRDVADLIESVVMTPAKKRAMGTENAPTGWWVGFQLRLDTDDGKEAWEAVKRGERPMMSIAGRCERKQIAEVDDE